MNSIQFAQLRDIAIEHLPDVQQTREHDKHFGKAFGREYCTSPTSYNRHLMDAANKFSADPTLTAVERAALGLLRELCLCGMEFPEIIGIGIVPQAKHDTRMRKIAEATKTLAELTDRKIPFHYPPAAAPESLPRADVAAVEAHAEQVETRLDTPDGNTVKIEANPLTPRAPATVTNKLRRNNYQDEYVSALLLLAPYWDKPACELPENLREIASPLWDVATPEGRQNLARQHDGQYDPALHWLWYDCSMDARTWWGLQDIAPREAAMLLCRLNPLECEHEDPERIYVDDDKSSPKRYLLLLRTFEDVAKVTPQARTLSQWLGIARDKQLQYHPWIDEYERGIGLAVPAHCGAPEKGEQSAAVEKTSSALHGEKPSVQAANNRKNHDITKERGCRRHILENWDNIEALHGAGADGRQVRNLLRREVAEDELKTLKTVRNCLKNLRNEKLIP